MVCFGNEEHMKITVTQEDIDRGFRKSGGGCPVALALVRQTHDTTVLVDCGKIMTAKGSISMPKRVKAFVSTFDKSEPVKPFSFSLPLEKLT
jgi:hypothetical protein